jgi:hypothetical protein
MQVILSAIATSRPTQWIVTQSRQRHKCASDPMHAVIYATRLDSATARDPRFSHGRAGFGHPGFGYVGRYRR